MFLHLRTSLLKPDFAFYVAWLVIVLHFTTVAQDTIPLPKQKRADFVITTRLHSTGHFPYTGAYLNRHLNVDINLFYERKGVGGFLFKAHDLEEKHSIVNYLQPGVFKKFPVGKRSWVGLFGGYIFNQTTRFSDGDSDAWASLIGSWQPVSWLKVENTALFFNLTKSELHPQWSNRTLVSVFVREFKFDVFLWHNLVFEANQQFTSGSLSVTLPKIRISEKVAVVTTFAVQSYLSSYKPSYAMRDGFLFTLAVPFTLQ